jgi:RNA polymerase sigma-70 factor (ECF subfamily)
MTTKDYNSAVDTHADNLFRFAIKHLKSEMAAKDIVQETFEKVWVKHREISMEKAKSYLFTTAYHAIIDWAKKEKRSGDIEQVKESGSDEQFSNFDIQSVLNQGLDKLPEIQKTVVLLRDYEGYDYAEIAKITDLNESQVKVYIFRARKSLKDFIQRMDLVI